MKCYLETFTSMLADGSGLLESVAGKGLVILALVIAATTLWRRGAAAARHLAWTTTFLCLLCLPVFVQVIPAWHPPTWIVPAGLNNQLPDSVSLVSQKSIPPETKPSPAVLENTGATPDSAKDLSSALAVEHNAVGWGGMVVSIWLAGMLIGCVRWLAVQVWLHRLSRRMQVCKDSDWLKLVENLRLDYQIKRPVKLLISDASVTPIMWGIWKPVVVLPAESRQWPAGRLGIVLRHELAHVKRWDCLTQEMAHAVCVLYWFNPLVWLAASRMRAEREKACDNFMLNTGARPAEYANHLVEIARQFSAAAHFGGAVAMARPSGLEQRVVAILDVHRNRNVLGKITAAFIVLAIFGLGLVIGGCSNKNSPTSWSLDKSGASTQLKQFLAAQETQSRALAKQDGNKLPSDFDAFYQAAETGNWQDATNLYQQMRKRLDGDSRLLGGWWSATLDAYGVFEEFPPGDKYAIAFGKDIIQSIPPGSIYFGGTDSGRFAVTALMESHADGKPFFMLSQNPLADGDYLHYLRAMYGGKIYTPTDADLQKSFQDYTTDAQRRLAHDQQFPNEPRQLKPGEEVKLDSNGRIQLSSHMNVIGIRELLTKTIFDKNPDREFYVEESFPLDWLYPYLEPHGLIMKIDRQPLPALSDEIVWRDRDYWTKYVTPMIGGWLKPDTTIGEVAAFAEKIHVKKDLSGFAGDPQFVQNEYWCKNYSKLRSSIGGLYAWRAQHAADAGERKHMNDAADFAFRQAFALCPYSLETVYRYVNLLLSEGRPADALLIAETAAKMPAMQGSNGGQMPGLIEQLKQQTKQSQTAK
jgi:beta-lactamase regulating signal transducer with metallopeptidase domain